MAGRQSAATERAIKEYKRLKKPNIYGIAFKHGIVPTTLYRALQKEKKVRK